MASIWPAPVLQTPSDRIEKVTSTEAGLPDRSTGRHTPALGGQGESYRILSGILHRHRRRNALKIIFVSSDMCERYLKVIRDKCSEAMHLLDRFHIVAKMTKALDEERAAESRRMALDGLTPVLQQSR